MNLEIVKPDDKLFSGEVEAAVFPGSNGSFEILNSHAPLIATLKEGTIKLTVSGKVESFDVNGGVVEVNNNKIIVLAE